MRRASTGIFACLVLTISGFAQDEAKPAAEAKKPSITAEEILEKSIEATGGRERREKITSSVTKGTITISAQGLQGSIEVYSKAPNKKLTVTTIQGFGDVKNGFDGQAGWNQNPKQGLRELEGAQLANARRDAVFNSDLKWKETYSKVELAGTEKSGDREFYAVRVTPREGPPRTVYYDSRTFLADHAETVVETPQGAITVKTYISDYRDVNGVKAPFELKQTTPAGDFLVKVAEIKYNTEIDDARFAKPEK